MAADYTRFSRRSITSTLLCLLILVCFASVALAQSAAGPLVAKLTVSDKRVKSVAFSPDGKLIAAGYGFFSNGGITIWNTADKSVVATPRLDQASRAGVSRVAFSDDGKLFAAATDRGQVILWRVGSWQTPKSLLLNQGDTTDLVFSPDSSKLAYSSDKVALVYDLKTAQPTIIARGSKGGRSFNGISFSPDGKLVIVCGDQAIQIWDVESKQVVSKWDTKTFGFFGRASGDGVHIIEGGGSIFGGKRVNIWRRADGSKIKQLTEFRDGLFTVAISHSGKLFALAGGDYGDGGSLSLWSLTDGRELGFASHGEFPIQNIAFSPDDSLLAAASEDGVVLIYAVDRLRGPELKKQAAALCGEIAIQDDKTYVVPLAKAPNPMRPMFEFSWRIEVVNPETVAGLVNFPVVLRDWSIESSAGGNRARIADVQSLLSRADSKSDHVVFGYVQNPGWNEGFVTKIFDDGSFVAANSSGRCRAYGSLAQLKTDFETVRKRLIAEGILEVGKEPLTIGADHYSTAFIELTSDGVTELRSDADNIAALLQGAPAKKREAFGRVFKQEKVFIDSLLNAGQTLPRQ
jgi:WD40 repeat protein